MTIVAPERPWLNLALLLIRTRGHVKLEALSTSPGRIPRCGIKSSFRLEGNHGWIITLVTDLQGLLMCMRAYTSLTILLSSQDHLLSPLINGKAVSMSKGRAGLGKCLC